GSEAGVDTESAEAGADDGSSADDAEAGTTDDEADGETVAADDLPVGAVADPASLASVEEVTCAFDEPVPLSERPRCYSVTVPENWNEPGGNEVVLPVAVFAADDGTDATDATIYLDGGPGGATLDLLWTSFDLLHEPQTGPRDYIAYDQRGVGLSEPSLACPELTELELASIGGELAEGTEGEASLAATGDCRDRLTGSGIDLTTYNSVASANDLEAIRALLGYDQFNLVGVSYGTRLAQTYMRQYPDAIRSVVLDSIVPVEIDLWTNLAPEAQGAFEQLFDGCAADEACAGANPDLENRFFTLLDDLDAEPIEVEFSDLLTGDSVDAVVDGDDVLGMVFQALYSQSLFSVVPAMVGQVEAGDYRAVEYLGSIQLTNLPYSATGMQLAVECNEEIAFESAEALAAVAPTEPGYVRLGQLDGDASLFEVCEIWQSGSAPEVENEPVVSDLPALLLAGGYDPITRPGNSDVVARSLSNHYSFLLPDEGHGIVSTPCGAEL
ncbi:MAG: alpha/beta fold hydrolase, partial [Actinomycetota bacterium]